MLPERRAISNDLAKIEIEEKAAGLAGIRGYAAVYYDGTPATEFQIGKISERIMPGTFSRAMKQGQDVVCLFNHNENFLLGRRSAKTLRLYEDDRGLRYSVDTPNTSYGRDVVEMISRGDMKGSSFAFGVNGANGENWRSEGDTMIREIRDVDLFDVSCVVSPAYSGTSLSLRSLQDWAEARNLTGDDLQKLMDQAAACGLSAEIDREATPGPAGADSESVPVVGAYSLDMARRRLRLLELESGITR